MDKGIKCDALLVIIQDSKTFSSLLTMLEPLLRNNEVGLYPRRIRSHTAGQSESL